MRHFFNRFFILLTLISFTTASAHTIYYSEDFSSQSRSVEKNNIVEQYFIFDNPVIGGVCLFDYNCEKYGVPLTNYSMLPLSGWERTTTDGGCAAGVYAVGSGAFLGGVDYIVPSTTEDGSTEGNVLGLIASWGITAQYKQTSTLPSGNYSLKISYYNAGGTTRIKKNLIGFIADDGTEYLDSIISFPVGKWITEEINFTLAETTTGYFTMGYNSNSPNGGSANAPHLFIDITLNSENTLDPSNGGDSSDNIVFEDSIVKSLCVENWDTNGDGELSYEEAAAVTELNNVFEENWGYTSFNEFQYFTKLTDIYGAFYNCGSLSSITIPSSVTSIGDLAFSYCYSLSSITIPSSVTSIGYYAFSFCSSLSSITIPSSVTSIGDQAFDNCISLSSITIPSSVTSIGDQAFEGCSSLTSVTIPESVTSIGNSAFSDCSSLTSVTIPESVISIGYHAFSGCNNLSNVISYIENPCQITLEFSFFYGISSECVLYVPQGTRNAYIAAGWTEEVFKGGIVEMKPSSSLTGNVLIFPDYNDKGNGSYTDEWTATVDGETWTLSGFNNNANGWAFVKCGSSNAETISTITSPAFNAAITDVVFTVDYTGFVNSAIFEVLNGETVIKTIDITDKWERGEVDVKVEGIPGYSYRLTLNNNKTVSNGTTAISKVALYTAGEYEAPAPALTAVDNKVWNFSDFETGDITQSKVVDNLELNGTSTKKITVDANSNSMDGYTFTKRLKLGGTGTSDARNIRFKVKPNSHITVYGMSGSTAERTLNLDSQQFGNTVATLVNDGTALGKVEFDYFTGTGDSEISLNQLDYYNLSDNTITSAAWNVGTSTDTYYGSGSTEASYYVDLSTYDELRIYRDDQTGFRAFFINASGTGTNVINQSSDVVSWNETSKCWAIDLSKVEKYNGKVYLNTIKSAAWSVTDVVKDITACKINNFSGETEANVYLYSANGGFNIYGVVVEPIIGGIPHAPEILNPSFELAAADTPLTEELNASNGPLTIYGWTEAVDAGFSNTEIRAAGSTSTTSQFGTAAPTDGEYALFFRHGWNGSGGVITTLTSAPLSTLPAGSYKLSIDYKQHYSYDNTQNSNTTLGIAMMNGETELGSAKSEGAAGVQGGSADATYFNDSEWSTLTAAFTVEEDVEGTTVVISFNAAGQRRSDFFIDNVRLELVSAEEAFLFAVNIEETIENGTLTVEPLEAEEGATITVTAIPAEEYILQEVTAYYLVMNTNADTGEVDMEQVDIELTVVEDGTFTFTMPASDVYVSATFKEARTKNEPGEYEDTPLTKEMFKRWDGFDDYAKVIDESPDWDGVDELPTEVGPYNTIYGTGPVSNTDYADITGATTMRIIATPGLVFRVLLNRQADQSFTELDSRISEYGYIDIDLSEYEYVHLNAIKTGWDSINGVVQSVILNPTDEYPFINLDADEWESLQNVYAQLSGMGWSQPWDMSVGKNRAYLLNGVKVEDGHISSLDLSNQGLTGSFPNSVLQFPYLQKLNMADNSLNGDISQAAQGNFPAKASLQELNISGNQLTGNIGAFAEVLTNLTTLDASSNKIDAVSPMIPTTVTKLNISRQTIPMVIQLHLADLDEKLISEVVPDIMRYDHQNHSFVDDLSLQLRQSEFDRTMWLSYTDGTAALTLPASDNVYYGQSGDILTASLTDNSGSSAGSTFQISLSFDKGDSNFDGAVNVLDLQTIINYMFEEIGTNPFNHTAANLWVDEIINVQDAVCLVNLLLADEGNGSGKRRKKRSFSEGSYDNGDATLFIDNGQLRINTTMPVSAFDIMVADCQQTEMSDELKALGFTCAIRQTADGGSHIVGYSLSGEEIPAGTLSICRLTGGEVQSAMLADRQAREISVTLNGSATSVTKVDDKRPVKEIKRIHLDSRHIIIVDENGNKILIKDE